MDEIDFTTWLLDSSTPSTRYLTLRHLLGRRETDPDVQNARQDMIATGPIPAILAQQTEEGHWAGEHSYYTPKYISTHWSMQLLVELAADGNDPRLQRGASFMLAATKDKVDQALARPEPGSSCFWGNLLRYTVHSGQADTPHAEEIVHCLIHDAQDAGWRCPINDGLPCAWGAARALWGLAALPVEHRSPGIKAAIQNGVAFLLEEHRLVEANYPTAGRIHPLWFRLNFPLFYQVDILFVLRVIAELSLLVHPGAQPALEWLASRRQSSGRWRGASPFRRRTWAALGNREETDRRVSLHAAIVLKEAGLPA